MFYVVELRICLLSIWPEDRRFRIQTRRFPWLGPSGGVAPEVLVYLCRQLGADRVDIERAISILE